MERTGWTDERLDDLARRMDSGFQRLDEDVRDLRVELREGLAALRTELGGEIGSLRSEHGGELARLRSEHGGELARLRTELGGEIATLRATLLRVGGGIMVGLVGVIAALLAGG